MILKEKFSLNSILLLAFLVLGCVSYSVEKNLNQQIGKNIHEIIRPNYKNLYVKEVVNEHHYLIRFNSSNDPSCSFEYVVRTRDDIVESWHFIDDIPTGYCDKFVTGT
jgi:hypothetical protein